jgi:5-methylcytosine-specific restriction enzyme subunit McrC
MTTEFPPLTESGEWSGPTELSEEDRLWIANQKDEEIIDGEKKRGLIKLEIRELGGKKYKLKAKGHVGAVPLPSGLVVNIQPKFKWANLFKLFEYTEEIFPRLGEEEVPAEEGDATLWDMFAKIFIRLAMGLIKTGLHRRYVTKTEEVTAIRGRLLIAQNIRSPQKFRVKHWCEFDELSYDVLENQCVLYCSTLLLRYVRKPRNKQDLILIRNLILSQDVTLKHKFTYSDVSSIILNRLNKRYETVLKYCKLVLRSVAYKEFSKGGLLIPDFTISMWDLFQTFVSQILEEHYEGTSTKVEQPTLRDRLLLDVERIPNYDEPGFRYRNQLPVTLPDNIIIKGRKKLILDTKWKFDKVPSGDWYQAISYSLGNECDTILLHPRDEKSRKISDGFKIAFPNFEHQELTIHIKTIDFQEAAQSTDFINDLRDQIVEIVENIELK